MKLSQGTSGQLSRSCRETCLRLAGGPAGDREPPCGQARNAL